MAKNKKIPELSLQNTFKTAEKTLKMNTPSKKEKEEVDKKFGEKKSAGGAASLKKGPVTERRAAEIISENYAPLSPMPSQNGGRTGADVLKRAGEVWREEKRTVSPYSGMSYREMTDDINNTYGGELRRGNIGQLDFYLERGKYDRERIEKAGRDELSELLSEKENEYNILFEMPRYSGGNYDVIDSRAKEVKALYDEIRSRINTYDTNEKIKKDYEREFYKYGKEALQGDSTYHPTENKMSDYDLINSLNKREDGKKNPLGHLTEGELGIYNSLYNENPQNPEKAEEFLKSIEGTLNKRLSDYETQEAYKYAKEHPYLAGAKSVAENVLGGAAAAIDNIAEGITGDVDTYDYTSRVVREGQALRQGGSQYMKENYGKGAEFAYGAGLSIVENLANIALFKGLGKVAGVGKAASGLSAFNMASGAAANSMINIADRGGSDIQILTGGVASGVAEYLFEKYSFDKLFDIKSTKGIKNIVKALAIQSGVEGSEEIFTETANIISDALIMQGNSENNIRRRQYVMQGMSAEEATKKVFFETVEQIASAGAAGMLSGGIMGGGAIALNNISHNNYVNNMGEAIVNNRPAFERLIQLGLDEGSADARFAAELISQGESISGKEAGALLETIIGESISKNGGIGNIIKNIYTLQGGDTGYITSKEAVDTARAVQHMAEGKVTDVDRALLQRSPGAVSLLSIVEGNEAAWKSLSGSAAQMQNAKGKMQNEIIKERGTPYTQKELVDENIYSNGQKVVIPENGRVAKNIVLNDESLRVRREKTKDYKNVETLAEDLKMKVMYAKGLTDSNGDAIGGIVTSKGIIINSDAENISRFVATHEFSHRLKQISPERWSAYQSYVIDKLKTDGNYYDVFEKKAAAYQSREDAIIDEEIAADYIGELFENETELAEFIRKDVKEASKVRNLWYNILDKLGLLDEKKKAQRLWASAYREGMSNKGKEFEGRKYSKEYSFSKQVDDALDYKMKSGYSVYVGKLPKLLAKCGLNPDLDMLINQGHLRDINHEKDSLHDEYHDIPREIIKQIPELLKRPAAIYDSISEKNKKNSVCLLTTKCDRDGNPIIAIIENSNKGGSYLNLKMETVNVEASNYVKSVYGRKGFLSHMNDVIDKDSVLYASKNGMERLFAEIERFNANNKKPKLNSDSKLQLLTRLDNLGFDTIIHQSRNVVKNNSVQNGKKKNDAERKQKQFEIIRQNNPAPNDYSTWVRSVEDVRNYREAWDYEEMFTPDFTEEMANKAIKRGEIKVYSSYPIGQGTFVTPSKMEAEGYSGNGKVYEKVVKLEDVAWITSLEGQYAKVDDRSYGSSKSITGTRLSDIENERAAQLEAENAELKKQLENLNLQLNLSPDTGSGLDTQAIKELAKGIKTKAASKVRLSELHQELVKLYSYMGGTAVDGGEVNKRIDSIAEMVLSKSTQTIENEENAELLKRIKEMRIYVPEREREDFRDGFEYFRKHNSFGWITLANDGTDLDVYWDELVEEYPAYFSEDVIGSEERLKRILEVREELAPSEESLYNSNEEYERAKANLKSYIKESYYNIPEGSENNKYVFYDKRTAEVQKELDKEKDKHQKDVERTTKKLERKLEKTEEMYEHEIDRIEGQHQRELDKEKDKHQKDVEKAEEKVTKMRDKYNREKVTKSIDRVFGYLFNISENPTDKRHIPENLKRDVKKFLDRFIYETKVTGKINPKETKVLVSVKLEGIGEAYKNILMTAWETDVNESPLLDERLTEAFSELLEEIPEDSSGNFKRFDDMTTSEIAIISDLLVGIHHSITQSNELFSQNIRETKSEASDKIYREMENIREKRKGSGERWVYSKEKNALRKLMNHINKFFTADMLQPWDAFHQIGGTAEILFKECRKAFNNHIRNLQKTKKAIKKAIGKLDINKITGSLSKDYTFELLGGAKIKLYKGQILSLYALYKRPQGRQHIESGGIVTDRLMWNEDGEKTGGAIHLSSQDIVKIFEVLSDEEIKMVDDIVEFMSKICAEWGNEASMKLLGFEKYGEGWYFPITVWDGSRKKEGKKKGDKKLTGQTFTKELVKNAGNAIVIDDFFDVALNHIVGMSLYNTIALPILDMERVLNHTIDESSVRQARIAIEKTFGSNVVNYIYRWMEEVNGNKQATNQDAEYEFLFRNATKMNIAFKLSVFLKQGTSIVRSLLVLNPKYILSAMDGVIHPKKTVEEMQEHIPIAYYKGLGFRNPYTSRDVKTAILDTEPFGDKAAFGWYGKMDDFTWGIIYTAVKKEIEENNPNIEIGSEEYWEKISERFDYVVDRTQVVDSVFHRSQIMRSKHFLVNTLTLYMSEPIKDFNAYRTEIQDAIKDNTKLKTISRATAVYLISRAITSAIGAFIKTLKDDEDDYYDKKGKRKSFGKRYTEHLKSSAIDESNPMKMIPYLRTVVDIVSGFSQKDISWEKLEKAVNEVKYSVAGNGKIWPRNIYNISASIAAVFGVPYGNALKEIEAISRTLMHQFHGKNEFTDYLISKSTWKEEDKSNQGKFIKHYKNAIQNGHPEEAELILSDYMAERFGGNFKNEKMAKVLKETARLYKDADKDEKSKVLYSLPDKDYTLDGKDKKISDSQYPDFVEKTYNSLWDLAYDFVTSKEYKEFSDDDKISSFGELKSYVKASQLSEDIGGYELEGWKKDVYSGEVTYAANALERKNEREYQDKREAYKETFDFDEEKYNEKEIGVIEKVESDAASYYASKEKGKEYNEKTLRHIKVYDEKLSSDMEIEEYAGIRAYAKKEAAMSDGKPSLKKDELKTYLDSTEYSPAVKAALFEAIGNKGWKNPYTGKKVGEWKY